MPSLVGGGADAVPGDITLAHRGVLFLNELTEFKPGVLNALREPLEAGKITISRAKYCVAFPANFQLVAAMNPCPCGYASDTRRSCRCSKERVSAYTRQSVRAFDRPLRSYYRGAFAVTRRIAQHAN